MTPPLSQSDGLGSAFGVLFKFTPTVDEKNRITLAWESSINAPATPQHSYGIPVFAEKLNTTLRVASGVSVSAGNLIPADVRQALYSAGFTGETASAFPHRADMFLNKPPTPGATLYVVVTPYLIDDK